MNHEQHEQQRAGRYVSSTLITGFRFTAWLNGLGLTLTLFCAIGIIETDLPPHFLKLPVGAFLCGLALAGLGLLWAYITQVSLCVQLTDARRRRMPWLPLFFTAIAYSLSMLTFAVGCWVVVGLAGIMYQAHADLPPRYGPMPFHQSAPAPGGAFQPGFDA